MSIDAKAFTLRLPPELYGEIAALAERERRSLHNQVLYLLDQALEAVEDAEDVRDAESRLAREVAIPFEQAVREREERRRASQKTR